jgi:hypothetical protein
MIVVWLSRGCVVVVWILRYSRDRQGRLVYHTVVVLCHLWVLLLYGGLAPYVLIAMTSSYSHNNGSGSVVKMVGPQWPWPGFAFLGHF